MAGEFGSTIRIEDGFTEPLRELASESLRAESAVSAVAKSLVNQGKRISEISSEAFGCASTIKNELIPAFREADDIKSFTLAVKDLIVNISQLGDGFIKVVGVIKNFSLALGSALYNAGRAVTESYKNVFDSLQKSIDKSIDDINLKDRLNALYGEAGGVAQARAYRLANEIGESASTITELSAKAAYEGIGTDSFERMMLLADKVGKLKPGETTESVANSLISNLKSGHDASTVAQMFGGGEIMERQLRRSGYERALNRGDLQKALSIAEKIAEQAGLTDKSYSSATKSMSQNYKEIFNTIDNIKKRLSQIYNESFAPTVEKINKLIKSEDFKRIVSILEYAVRLAGRIINWFTEAMVDNINVIAALLGIGIISKFGLMLRLIGLVGGKAVWLAKLLGFGGKGAVATGAFMSRVAGGVAAAGGAIGGAAKAAGGRFASIATDMATTIGSTAIGQKMAMAGGAAKGAVAKAGSAVASSSVGAAASNAAKTVGNKLGGAVSKVGSKLGTLVSKVKNLSIVSMLLPGPWTLIGGAIAGILYGLHKLLGVSNSFMGTLAGGYRFAVNVFENLIILIADVLPTKLKVIGLRIKQGFIKGIGFIKSKAGELIAWIISALQDFLKDSIIGKGLLKLGIDFNGAAEEARKWASNFGADEKRSVERIEKRIQELNGNQRQFVSVMEGVEEAYKTGGASVVNWLKKLVGIGKDQADSEEKIKDDTDKIRKINEQEEELRWLKAFSDRQIMSQINNNTSNSRSLTVNSANPVLAAEIVRRFSTVSNRAAM